ncbi:sensor histidine kinase [Paenibacillus assamensis]|uniref:sensor histidine kinase n=1 Tax=Paenibacillus assamensis TaxID=311244 RepID=UPI0004279B63|nr:HAMP domain-containing sensor histidine kinase [Paenibacillus assamensis]
MAKLKMIQSFRAKMIMMLGLSMLYSGIVTFATYKVFQTYYHLTVKMESPLADVRFFIKKIGDINFFLIFFIPLSIFFFFLLTKRYANYFSQISDGIHHLANGDFNHRVQLATKDEFGAIAADINAASVQLQEAVKRGDFAESSKEQLILNLAHDLRTPLTSVLGYLDFILKDEHLTPEQTKHYTTIAYTKSKRLEKLIDELFGITKMNYGMVSMERQSIDLSELLHQLSEELYPMFESNHLISRIRVASDLTIQGDGELLARVFENLLTNAIRYGNDGQFVDINGFVEDRDIVVQVVNYGSQIDPEDLPHLFDMFYIADKARTHQEGSTGLGLFIAKNIVEQHQGSITAESNVVRTKFEVRLPRRKETTETSSLSANT